MKAKVTKRRVGAFAFLVFWERSGIRMSARRHDYVKDSKESRMLGFGAYVKARSRLDGDAGISKRKIDEAKSSHSTRELGKTLRRIDYLAKNAMRERQKCK